MMVELGYVPKNPSSKTISVLSGYEIVCKDKHSYWMSMETVPVVDEVLHKFLHGSDTKTKNNFQETIDRGPIKVPDSIFDSIIGYDKYKKSMLRALRAKKPVHVLLVGPPASGKTLFMLQISKYVEGAEYYRGEHKITKTGLIEFIIDKKPRILLIDEIAEVPKSDRHTLLGITDTGIVTVLKHDTRHRIKVEQGYGVQQQRSIN